MPCTVAKTVAKAGMEDASNSSTMRNRIRRMKEATSLAEAAGTPFVCAKERTCEQNRDGDGTVDSRSNQCGEVRFTPRVAVQLGLLSSTDGREGAQSKSKGEEDGKRAPHASLMLHECKREAENEGDTRLRYHRCIAALTP